MGFSQARWWVAGAALTLLVLLGVRYEHHRHRHLLHTGDALVPLAVTAMDGSAATLAPTGRAQIVNVFATWCSPCRQEMPAFATLARELQRRGISVMGIDQQEGAVQVARFARQFAVSYPIYIDRNGMTHDILGARMIPFTMYIDARGIIRWQHAGPMSKTDMGNLTFLARSTE
jgi:thiol-disulfide isomerase/thioredoxin